MTRTANADGKNGEGPMNKINIKRLILAGLITLGVFIGMEILVEYLIAGVYFYEYK
jgi:hypothetical protein